MALKLVPPGTRGNKFWIAYGRHNDKVVSMSTGQLQRTRAEAWLRQQLKPGGALWERAVDAQRNFAAAAEAYALAKDIDLALPQGSKERAAARDINRLIEVLGHRQVAQINEFDLHQAAKEIFPTQQAETRNRHALKPALAILHKATKAWKLQRIEAAMFPEKAPATRAVALEIDELLLRAIPAGARASAPGSSVALRRLAVLWFLRQGTRISDTLQITWSDIDLDPARETCRLLVGKTQRWRETALDPDVAEALRAIPEDQRQGPLFPWRQKSGVYRWLRPLVRELGIQFTPHQGRHTLGKRLNDAGAGLRTIMEALGHADVKSSLRYQAGDIAIVRLALHNLAAKRAQGRTGAA
ncbi:MAG TPA: tyrosine-type recombinase/integrase [Stellaceae bacterium]